MNFQHVFDDSVKKICQNYILDLVIRKPNYNKNRLSLKIKATWYYLKKKCRSVLSMG